MSHYPFWRIGPQGGMTISTYQLTQFLESEGFGIYKTHGDRTEDGVLFRNAVGILQGHNAKSVKRFIQEYVESDTTAPEDERLRFLDTWVSKSPKTVETYLNALPIFTDGGKNDTNPLSIFRDTKDKCYLPFKNAVVEISADNIVLKDWVDVVTSGAVWETSIIPRCIDLPENLSQSGPDMPVTLQSESSPFVDFIRYAFKHGVQPKARGNNPNEGTENPRYIDSLTGFETAFGYLIHRYNPPDSMCSVVFVDADSTSDKAEGGNGKSLSLESIQYVRNLESVDGRRFRKTAQDSSRFNFSNVTVATEFVLVNDLNPDFDLTTIFGAVTDDMEIEGKGKDKIVIPKNKKPKLALTTNYIIDGVGGSYDRRQHIVEFGNFFNNALKLEPKVKIRDVIGKGLFEDDFTDEDWNAFFVYAIQCVHRYMRLGLVAAPNSNYRNRVLVSAVEGKNGSGEVTDWIRNWVNHDRLEGGYDQTGIAVDDLYSKFSYENSFLASTNWDRAKFKKAVYEFVFASPELEYNPDLAHKGTGMNQRRWLCGPKGDQRDTIKITSSVIG